MPRAEGIMSTTESRESHRATEPPRRKRAGAYIDYRADREPYAGPGRKPAATMCGNFRAARAGEAIPTLSVVIDRDAAQCLLGQSDDWRLVEAYVFKSDTSRYCWVSPLLGTIHQDWRAPRHFVWTAPAFRSGKRVLR